MRLSVVLEGRYTGYKPSLNKKNNFLLAKYKKATITFIVGLQSKKKRQIIKLNTEKNYAKLFQVPDKFLKPLINCTTKLCLTLVLMDKI